MYSDTDSTGLPFIVPTHTVLQSNKLTSSSQIIVTLVLNADGRSPVKVVRRAFESEKGKEKKPEVVAWKLQVERGSEVCRSGRLPGMILSIVFRLRCAYFTPEQTLSQL